VLPTSRLLCLPSDFYKCSAFLTHLAFTTTSQHKSPISLSSPSIITMHLTSLLVLASSASAITMPNFLDVSQLLPRRNSGCPSVWSSISSELTQNFLSGGQCNANARAAIRAVFHDCGGKPLISVSSSVDTHRRQHGKSLSVQTTAVMGLLLRLMNLVATRTAASPPL
jgi:hypothetical protein